MLEYLLKFSACLAIFLVFYKLFLEKENMHQLKRYYLLLAIFSALSIPLITFTTYIEPVISTVTEFPRVQNVDIQPETLQEPTNYLPIILWSLYGVGVLLFGIKFILNLSKIVFKIKQNPKHKAQNFTHVLLRDLVTPHTFFSYIFLNKQKFETQQIPHEVFIHEEAHAKQKHSLDVLLIEILQIIFWFNPLIYFTKESIKMNHEFLADEAVLKQGISPSLYQQLLLTFSSNVIEPHLANAINYSSIKKRFTVMKTHTSKQKIWLRSLLLLPLVSLTLYGFSERNVIEKPIAQSNSNPQNVKAAIDTNSEKDYYYKNVTIEFVDKNKNILESKKYSELTEEQKLRLPNPPKTPTKKQPTQTELDTWKDGKIYGVWINNKRIKNDVLEKSETSDFSLYYVSKLEKNAVNYGKHYYQVNLYTNEEYKKLYRNGVQPLGEGAVLRLMSNTDEGSYPVLEISFNPDIFKLNGKETSLVQLKEDFAKATNNSESDLRIKTVGGIKMSLITEIMDELKGDLKQIRLDEAAYIIGDTTQQKATAEEIAEYNKLASQHNDKPEKLRIIKQIDFERMEYLYKKMSKEQQAKAEPFPNFPPPPPPATGFVNVNGETLFVIHYNPKRYYNKKGYLVDKNGKILNGNIQVNASDVLPGHYITKIYKDNKVVVEFNDNMQKQQQATAEEVAEYNKLASQHNDKPERNRIYKQKDVERMEYIYKRMSKDQQANAEPFPNFPPPPPPAPESPKAMKVKEVPQPPVPADATPAQKKKMQATIDSYEKEVPPPPPPPAPKSPLDHVIEMAKKGATFYYEGKSISSDKAIELLKKNKELNISTKQSDSKNPKVYISKEPITINNPKKQTGFIGTEGMPKPTVKNAASHLKVMNRHGAKFYLDETEVTFEDALKAVRNNKNADISSTTEPPIVEIESKFIGDFGKK